ncbi:MAG: multifunctional oxoglutarate decarboxylase/oxoglutarate dehydrogenase thiamine pyrophosphate-binding subunit/dihydrolipoyllysine-residue succinyltransferase subunit [Planctomycetes bacterium]|nr:multifunctional oxoglutarate decarboxylase/oxoglutarate dehydrogenase thiamine pyrophosphate-binding subunit/dihydrolipoyllysine-residue succinyltransferase subunit [Planctomycetota bacterium]
MVAPDAVSEEWQRFFETHLPPEHLPKRAVAAPADAAATNGHGAAAAEPSAAELGYEPLRGIAAKIAGNMTESLGVPTATSTRDVLVKVLEENRRIINEYLVGEFRGKASFTHVIAWAMVKALQAVPGMLVRYREVDGKPHREQVRTINIGIAVDVQQGDGPRSLVVPNVRDCGSMNFATFIAAYEAQVRKARRGKLGPEDFQDTTCTLTNPGTIGTVSSLPRLMVGQSFILATGAIAYPAPWRGASEETITELGIGRVMTVTSTYDHRVIQGADSGELLKTIDELLNGEHGFYEQLFRDLTIPYQPMRLEQDRRVSLGSPMRENQTLERAARVMQYIRAYRVRGYLLANLDPLVYEPKTFPELEMDSYGLTIWDLDRTFYTGGTHTVERATLREIRDVLRKTYTRRIGVEYMHMVDPEQKEWLRRRMESTCNEEELPREVVLRVLDRLVEAEAFERFLHTRFVGHKRFSLEGGETLIPVLDALLEHAAAHGVDHGVIGMAHRGRLNVLAHTLGKPLTRIFGEFEGYIDPSSTQGSGDVKYHLGAEDVFEASNGREIKLQLACNPSHLEAVDPVVEGMVRAIQDRRGRNDEARRQVLPILVHGDAAFAGQGVVHETLQMSQLQGYRTGGTVHVIVNNQIGYTTNPDDARSTPFCTDVAKGIQAPIFHVNGDDPLAAVRMVRLALEYRQRYQRDVVIDIVCYRRHGHNEGDEPSFTQPLLYRKIEAHPSVRAIYQDWLVRAGWLEAADAEKFNEALQQRFRESLEQVRQSQAPTEDRQHDAAVRSAKPAWVGRRSTLLSGERLTELLDALCTLPADFAAHPKIEMLLDRRRSMARDEHPFDFATAESLAFATLLVDGHPVRLAGQDSGRGTFSQRHSVLVDIRTGGEYVPLNHLAPSRVAEQQATYEVVDSLLSEEAALGFEYGFSVARPECLNLWEAQFGDFCNGAQIQIDQFIAAGEAKWGQSTGLVLLLPHGYDGQGPEHSSARLERFLQLCAEGNMRVANPSTAAQYFHLLRRQALDPDRKPLVVMTPKSLLRQRTAGSTLAELADALFQSVIVDAPGVPDAAVERVVFCCGKVYYDLDAERRENGPGNAAIVRVEQLAPWPRAEVDAVFARFASARDFVWCQEEPANMGAWSYVRNRAAFTRYAGRPDAASPATGVSQVHKQEQHALVQDALHATAEPQA